MTKHTDLLAQHAKASAQTVALRADLATAEADHATLRNISGADLLAQPERLTDIATARARSEELVTLHREMLNAAIDAETAAARAVVASEADAMTSQIRAAKKKVTTWLDRETELLDALEAHSGARYNRPSFDSNRPLPGEQRTLRLANIGGLEAEVARLERQHAALLAAAEGEEPTNVCPEVDLPDSLLPGGILPSPVVIERHQEAAAREAEAAAFEAEMTEATTAIKAALSALGSNEELEPMMPGQRPRRSWLNDWSGNLSSILQALPVEVVEAVMPHLMTIAELAGPGAALDIARNIHVKEVA